MAGDFRDMYEAWCEVEGVVPLDANTIGKQMRQRNYHSDPFGKRRRSAWKGLSVKQSQPGDAEDTVDEEVG